MPGLCYEVRVFIWDWGKGVQAGVQFFFFKLSIFSTPVERVLLFSHQDHIPDAEKDISCLG